MNNPTDPFVHEAEILIIGGGLAGLTAARKALNEGRDIIIVDKGPWGHSGTSGINWGHDMTSNEWTLDDGTSSLPTIISYNEGLVDQTYALAICKAVHEARPNATSEQMGSIAERLKNGYPAARNASLPTVTDHGCFPRYFSQYIRSKGVRIFDRTMVLDLLFNDEGAAIGAVALGLVNGEARIFRAQAVILATGCYSWVSGWNGASPHTIAGPESTGDGHRMLLNAGVALSDMEQMPVDYVQWDPLPARQSMGVSGASIVNYDRLINTKGEYFVCPYAANPLLSNAVLMRLTFREILNGRATSHNGILKDTTNSETDDRYYRRCAERLHDLGYELPERVEVVPEQWESAAHPWKLDTSSQTQIPGLFYAGSGMGAWVGVGYFCCVGSGWLAGHGASDYVKEQGSSKFNFTQAKALLIKAFDLLKNMPKDPIRSTTVVRSIQKAFWSGLSPIRDEQGIRASIEMLTSIENELMPRIWVPTKTKRLNSDWRVAIEARSLLTCALGTAHAALARTETRGAHWRRDYPVTDNANWLKHIVVNLSDSIWSVSVENIDDSIMPAEKVAKLVLDIDLLD
jgi:succinate dehydrogenase/fumarate reductase flavoprotein subunit